VTLHVGPSGGDGRASSLSSTDPGSQAGTNDAGLARRPSFTRMPSASTPVCGSHHTRQSHSRRRVAFQDDEVLERQFHAAGAGRWSRSPPNHPANATFGAKLPMCSRTEPNGRPTEDAAWQASATTHYRCIPTRLADSQPRRISRRGRAARRARPRDCSRWPRWTAHAGGDSSCDVPRPEPECG